MIITGAREVRMVRLEPMCVIIKPGAKANHMIQLDVTGKAQREQFEV